jgi:geranylgeranyl diphosphate synthase type 3
MFALTETVAALRLVMQLMQLFSENKSDFSNLTHTFGLYFQIYNDYRNLFRMEITSELLVVDI